MRRAISLLAAMLLAMVLLAVTVETGIAEPRKKNQISVPVECDNGKEYTLAFNGEGNAGQVESANSNVIPKNYSVTYLQNGKEIARDEFHQGNLERQKDLIICTGQIRTTISGLGDVTAVFDFKGLVTPRST